MTQQYAGILESARRCQATERAVGIATDRPDYFYAGLTWIKDEPFTPEILAAMSNSELLVLTTPEGLPIAYALTDGFGTLRSKPLAERN